MLGAGCREGGGGADLWFLNFLLRPVYFRNDILQKAHLFNPIQNLPPHLSIGHNYTPPPGPQGDIVVSLCHSENNRNAFSDTWV